MSAPVLEAARAERARLEERCAWHLGQLDRLERQLEALKEIERLAERLGHGTAGEAPGTPPGGPVGGAQPGPSGVSPARSVPTGAAESGRQRRVAKQAGIAAHIHPHLLRHAFGDHVARHAGIRAAQALLGHASIDTTADTYTGQPSLDELTASIAFFGYRQLPPENPTENPWKATTGIEPVDPESRLFPGGFSEEP